MYYQSQVGPADAYALANNAKRATINSVYIDPRPWSATFNQQVDCDQWGIDNGLCAYGLAWGETSLPANGVTYVAPTNTYVTAAGADPGSGVDVGACADPSGITSEASPGWAAWLEAFRTQPRACRGNLDVDSDKLDGAMSTYLNSNGWSVYFPLMLKDQKYVLHLRAYLKRYLGITDGGWWYAFGHENGALFNDVA